MKYGISRLFKNNKLINKSLWYNNEIIAYDKYIYNLPKYTTIYAQEQHTNQKIDFITFSNDKFEYICQQYRINGDENKYYLVGGYFFRSDSNLIDNRYSTYFICSVLDSITANDSIQLSIKGNYADSKIIRYDLCIGGVNSFDALTDTKTQ